MNPHETAARAKKARKLIEQIYRVNAANPLQALPLLNPAELARGLKAQTPAWWAKLAAQAGAKPPSETTIEVVLAHFRAQAASCACATCGRRGGGHAGWCSAESYLREQADRADYRTVLATRLHVDACAMWVDALRRLTRGDAESAIQHFGWAEEAADKALALVVERDAKARAA